MFGFNSLEELCAVLKPENCTCESLGIIGKTDDVIDFCQCSLPDPSTENHSGAQLLPALITGVAIFALLGNTVVVMVKSRKKAMKTRHTYLITLLAICDIFFACFVLIYYVPAFFTSHWIYGLVGCKLISSAQTMGAWVSIGLILIIAMERFYGIVYPLRRDMTSYRMYALLVTNVVVATIVVVPRILHLDIHRERHTCHEDWYSVDVIYPILYDWFTFIFYSLAPIISISVLYVIIFRKLSRTLFKHQQEQSQYMDRITKQRLRSNKKSMLLLVAVLVAFVVCTFPNKIRWLILTNVRSSDNSFKEEMENPYFFVVTEVLYTIHLAINPIIYAVSDTRFRQHVCSLFGRQKRQPSAVSGRTQSIEMD